MERNLTLAEKRNEYYRIMTKDKRKLILTKFNNSCAKCGGFDNLTIDHIVALSLGGENEDDNYQVLCKRCNSSKGGRRGSLKEMDAAKPVFSYRFNPELIKEVEKLAKKENRNLTNFIETALIQIVEESKKKKK